VAPTVMRFALRRALREVEYVRAVRPRRARGLVAEVYRQVERDFGMLAPPVALHSPAPDVLAAVWAMLRESLVAGPAVARAGKEVVASAVSAANACPYCVEVHGMALGSLGRAAEAAAIDAGEPGTIGDAGVRALALWAGGDGLLPAGLPAAAAAELTAVAVAFHHLNRMVSVFLVPSPLPAAVPEPARETVRAVLGRFLKPGEAPAAGDALALLPADAVDPPVWAVPGTVLAETFGRAGAVLGALDAVPPRVRALLRRELASWDGKPPGLGRAWADGPIGELPAHERAAGRFALLVAKAAYQVDASVVAATLLDERGLVETAAWASFAAATELGARLYDGAAGEDTPATGTG
jgi:AhpD family alkylhydroperoxidase